MTHAFWKQAILISATVAVLAITGVATLAWLRRPSAPSVPGARATSAPLLYHDPTGSVYDLHLKMTQLEERLLSSERYSRRLEEEVTRLRGTDEAGQKERAALVKRVAQLEAQLALLRRATETPRTAAPPAAAPNAPAGGTDTGAGTGTEEAPPASEGTTTP